MAYDTGFSRRAASEREIQPVAIISVDPISRTAVGLTKTRHDIRINCAYATGDTITVPATGEQWYVERFDMEWRLYGRIPFNDPTLNIKPEEGQVSVGSAYGPLELNGPEVRVNSKMFRLNDVYYRDNGTTLERSADKVNWAPVSSAQADDLVQSVAAALTGFQGADLSGAASALQDWGGSVQAIVDNFSEFWNLLCQNVFVGGFKDLGFGDTDVAKMIDGFQNFVNYLFSTIFCDFNGDLTPQTLLARVRDLLAPVASNPFILALQEFFTLVSGSTGSLLQDAIGGITQFIQTLFDVLFCQADPTQLQAILDATGDVFGPISIIQAIEAFFDVFRLNPFLQGLSSFLQSIAPGLFTGNLLQDAVIGGTKFLSTLFGVLTCDPNSLTTLAGFLGGTQNLTTPQGILATLGGLVSGLMTNPLIVAIKKFATDFLGLGGTLLQQIITGTGSLFNWFFKALTTFLPFVPWQALLPFLNWTAINNATVPGINWPSLLTTNLFGMFDSLFNGLLGNAAGAFQNFITNLGTLLNGMGLLGGNFNPLAAVQYFLTDILGIASYDLNGVLQFGGTLVSNVLGAVGAFFENVAAFFGFDLRDFAEGALSPIQMAALFFKNIEKALLAWITEFVFGGQFNTLLEWAQANVTGPIVGNLLKGLNVDPAKYGIQSITDIATVGLGVLGDIAGTLLTKFSQIPANLVQGVLPPAVIGSIPVANISDTSPNLITLGTFADTINIEANDGWVWDNSQNAPQSSGGSAKVTINPPKNRYLYSRQAVPVGVGDRLVVTASVKTDAVAVSPSGSTPISIAIIPFVGNDQQPVIVIGNRIQNSATWTTIGNTTIAPYVVTDPSWTTVVVRLGVDQTATSGVVWWDDISLKKTGGLIQGNVDSLNTAWNQMIGGLKNTGQNTTGLDWTSLYDAAFTARNVADTGYSYSTNTNTTLFGDYRGGSTFYSPQSLIASLFSVKVDGVNTFADLLYYLVYWLSGGTSSVQTVQGVNGAGLTNKDYNSTTRLRLDLINTAMFSDVAGGTVFDPAKLPTLITSLASLKADGTATMNTLLGYLVAGLSNNTVSGSTVGQVNQATSVVSTTTARINDTNTKLFGLPQGGNNGKVLTTALDLNSLNTVGSGVFVKKTSGAYTTVYNSSGVRIPYSFWDQPITSSTDITVFNDTSQQLYYDPNTGTGPTGACGVRAANSGWYQIEIGYRVRGGSDNIKFGYSWNLTPCLFKRGTIPPVKVGASSTFLCTNSFGPQGFGQDYAQSNFIYYLYANEVIYPGYFWASDGIFIPTTDTVISASTTGTYFSMSLLNRSLA